MPGFGGNRLGFQGVLTQIQEGSLLSGEVFGVMKSKDEPADRCHRQARSVECVLDRSLSVSGREGLEEETGRRFTLTVL